MDPVESSTKSVKPKPKNQKPAAPKQTNNQQQRQRQSHQQSAGSPSQPQEEDRAFVSADDREKDERQKRRPKQAQRDKNKEPEIEKDSLENSTDQDQRPSLLGSIEFKSEDENEKRKFKQRDVFDSDPDKKREHNFERSRDPRDKNWNRDRTEKKDDTDESDEDSSSDEDSLQNENDDGDQHKLRYGYTFWFNRRIQGARNQNYENYEKNIKKIASFDTAEKFWGYYNHLVRPNELPVTSDYHLFKRGIKPMWEDKANVSGGKWIVRLPKGMASRSWEDLIIAMMGEQFDVGEEICGCVISIRYQADIISIWNRNATDTEVKNKIRDTLSVVLSLPSNALMEYKGHESSLKDYSSFRNTDVYRQST